MRDFVEGMHKVGDAMAAVISAQVTKEAQARLEREEGEAQGQAPPGKTIDQH